MSTLVRLTFVGALIAACGDRAGPSDTTAGDTTGSPATTDGTSTGSTSSSTTGTSSDATGTTDATAGTSSDTTGTSSTTDATTGTSSTSDGSTTGGESTGAATTDDSTTGGGLSHAVDIQPIWDANCVNSCHQPGGSASAYFHLIPDEAYAAIVSQSSISYPTLTLVTPGDRTTSYLWHKLDGTQVEAGGGGSKMPLGITLPPEQIATIGTWIDQGAKP